MKTLDLVILGLLILGGYRGFRKGFLMELIAIVALVIGVIGSFKLLHYGMDILEEQFNVTSELLPFLSFIIIFILIILLVNVLGSMTRRLVHMTPLGGVDNLAGAFIGVIKWAFGLSVLIWLFSSIGITVPLKAQEGTYLYPMVSSFAPFIADKISVLFPFTDQIFDSVNNYIHSANP